MSELLDFYKGMDISSLPEEEDEGMTIYDFDGKVIEPFELMKKYGVNAVRLRIWHTPQNVPEARGYCDLKHTIAMAKRAHKYGMSFMLDFHYSDFWADPGQQRKPKEWEKISGSDLEKTVKNYTKDTLLALEKEGVLPDIVQIGNEIRSGFLFPDGELPNWTGMVRLLNAGIQGARETASSDRLQIMIHLDQGGRYHCIKEWFTKAFENGLEDFDLIGLSYYPFWHGTFADLKETLLKLAEDYHKPILIVETAHAWRQGDGGFIDEKQGQIAGVETTPQGQAKVLRLVENIAASLPNRMGRGIYYWEPLCIPRSGRGGWSYNMGIIDEKGHVMEAVKEFTFNRTDADGEKPAKIYNPQPIMVHDKSKIQLPKTLPVLYYDGHIENRKAEWEKDAFADESKTEYNISGQVDGVEEFTSIKVCIVSDEDKEENLLQDSNWEAGFAHWDIKKSGEQVAAYISPEFIDPFPAPPLNSLKVEAEKNFTFSVSQKISPGESGNYSLSVEFCGIDTTNVDVRLFAECNSKRWEEIIHPTESGWELYKIKNISYEKGELTVGICISAPPMYGMMRRFLLSRS